MRQAFTLGNMPGGMISELIAAINASVSLVTANCRPRRLIRSQRRMLVNGVTVQGYESASLLLSGIATRPDCTFLDAFE